MPITKWGYRETTDVDGVAEAIKKNPGGVIEFGGASSRFAGKVEITTIMDCVEPGPDSKAEFFKWDINDGFPPSYLSWWLDNFEWSLCTHTLEDLFWPFPLLKELPKISRRGYLSFTSPFLELTDWNGSLGFIHHHWIFTVNKSGELVCWPKIPLIMQNEFLFARKKTAGKGTELGLNELEIWWEGDLPFKMIGGPHWHRESIIASYKKLVEGDWIDA